MAPTIVRRVFPTNRHTTTYLEAGPPDGPAMFFIHGWPELGAMWRSQLDHFAALGYYCIAPDMRGYGESSVPKPLEAYALEEIVRDVVDLHAELRCGPAIWVGHDWGSPVAWSLAGHHPELSRAVVSLCVPYFAEGFSPETLLPLVDRTVYPEDNYPTGQWDYQFYYREAFANAAAAFEADISATFRALIRSGDPRHFGRPSRTATVRRDGGWFGGAGRAPDVPRDPAVLSEEALEGYILAFERTGFSGADAWYMNAARNREYAARLPHAGKLPLPALFLHGRYDTVCETVQSRMAEPMRRDCSDLDERILDTGHWMVQERPEEVNAAIAAWLGLRP
jgi:pimeloyl-ACP methyl ester carboxylesterase